MSMFHIKTKLGESSIHGIGLFTDEDISEGDVIYVANLSIDLILSDDKFLSLSNDEKETIQNYGYFDKTLKKWHLSFDDVRFCNHALNANMTLRNGKLIAKKDISKGEELTQNYSEFEDLRDELKK